MRNPDFLHPQLANDCQVLGWMPLSCLLMMNNATVPWCILVPERQGVSEIYHLSQEDQQVLVRESAALGECLMELFHGDKLNIAALGNLVPQLHVHHVVRFRTDPAWPDPVWGKLASKPYSPEKMLQTGDLIIDCLQTRIEFNREHQ